MTNPSRIKGTKAESAVVAWLRDNGFPHADRQPGRGSRDQGDIDVCPGIIAEVKAYKLPGTGLPGPALLAVWMRQTETERTHADADIAFLVVKRPGTTDVSRWLAYVTAWTLAELIYPRMSSAAHESPACHDPVCLSMASLAALLRADGWGDPQ